MSRTGLRRFPRRARIVTDQMWILDLLDHLYVVELDVEELVDGLERAADGDVVLELDGDFVVDERLEEAINCVSAPTMA